MNLVQKASGDCENFNPKKIYETVLSTGASKKLAKETVNLVKENYYKGITTKEILNLILNNIKKEPGLSQRYNLKRAIMTLGPSGYPFEQYFARILDNYGYHTRTPNIIKGKRIWHEVDIIADKNDKTYMIECKYHNFVGTNTKLHPAMYTYARFLDIGLFDTPWLATNTKCVNDAIEYAKGVKMKITSWNYPENASLRKLIEDKNLYPITVIKDIKRKTIEKLLELGLVLAEDILKEDSKELAKEINLTEYDIDKIKKEINEIFRN